MHEAPVDLSTKHRPITDLFAQPASPAAWARYQLTADQLDFFRAQGYLKGVPVLDNEQVDSLREALDRMSSPAHPGNDFFYEYHSNESVDRSKVLFHALGAWRVEPAFHDLLWAPAFRMAAYQLLGGSVRQFHDQLFSKPAGHGGVVAWHQDYSYWTWTKPMAHLTCWVALDDVTVENGCLWYVPESHRWGLLPITGLSGEMDAVMTVLDDARQSAFEKRTPMEMKKGMACFHHPLMMHGSYENRSNRQRRAAVLNVVRDGVWSNADVLQLKDENKKFPILAQGEPLGGQFYPQLFSAEREIGESAPSVPVMEPS